MAEAARDQLLAAIKGMRDTGAYADLIITCQDESYDVHKVVVCAQSDFFAKAVNFSVGKEADDNKIDLPEDDPAIVALLIQYWYEAEYDPICPPAAQPADGQTYYAPQSAPHSCLGTKGCGNHQYMSRICTHHECSSQCTYTCSNFICSTCCAPPAGSAEQLITHAKVYEVADKYGVTGLKTLSAEKFKRACWKWWNDTNFPVAAQHALSTTLDYDTGLRDTVHQTIAAHMDLLDKPEVEDLLSTFNGLAFRLLKEKFKKGGSA